MAVAWRDSNSSNNAGGGTTITCTFPTGLTAGDIMILGVGVRGGTDTTITDPADWTLLGSQVNSTTVLAQKLYWKVATAADVTAGSVDITITSNKASASVAAISGASDVTPVAAEYGGQANASHENITAPSIGPWASAAGVLVFVGSHATGTTESLQDVSFALDSQSSSTGAGAGSRTTTACAYDLRTATSYTSSAVVIGGAAVNIGHMVWIAPPAAAADRVPYSTPYPQLLAH